MIDPIIYLIWSLLLVVVAGCLPIRYRAILAAAAGLAFLAVYAPAAAAVLCFVYLQSVVLFAFAKTRARGSGARKNAPYLILFNLLFVDFLSDVVSMSLVLIAVSFSVVRVFIAIKRFANSRTAMSADFLEWGFVSLFYLPTLMVGPIFSSYAMWESVKKSEALPYKTAQEFRLIFTGLFLAVLVSPFFSKVAERLPDIVTSRLADMLSGVRGIMWLVEFPLVAVSLFLALFAAFWGQSMMAERLSRLIGFEVPQNFNQPWLAIDIRDFWTRWHVSMAEFVKNYIFIPLNIAGYGARISIFTAFLFMGLWHNVSIGYLLWGIGHGTLLALWPQALSYDNRIVAWFSRLSTFAAVITLSYVANYAFVHP